MTTLARNLQLATHNRRNDDRQQLLANSRGNKKRQRSRAKSNRIYTWNLRYPFLKMNWKDWTIWTSNSFSSFNSISNYMYLCIYIYICIYNSFSWRVNPLKLASIVFHFILSLSIKLSSLYTSCHVSLFITYLKACVRFSILKPFQTGCKPTEEEF